MPSVEDASQHQRPQDSSPRPSDRGLARRRNSSRHRTTSTSSSKRNSIARTSIIDPGRSRMKQDSVESGSLSSRRRRATSARRRPSEAPQESTDRNNSQPGRLSVSKVVNTQSQAPTTPVAHNLSGRRSSVTFDLENNSVRIYKPSPRKYHRDDEQSNFIWIAVIIFLAGTFLTLFPHHSRSCGLLHISDAFMPLSQMIFFVQVSAVHAHPRSCSLLIKTLR